MCLYLLKNSVKKGKLENRTEIACYFRIGCLKIYSKRQMDDKILQRKTKKSTHQKKKKQYKKRKKRDMKKSKKKTRNDL